MRRLFAPGIAVLLCTIALLLLTSGMAVAQEAAPAAADALQAEISTITSATRTYSWEITKTVEPAALDLAAGDSQNLSYTIHLTRSTQTSEAQISGVVTLTNPGEPPANVTDLIVEVQNMGPAAVDCVQPFPFDVNGSSTVCTYELLVNNAASRYVTATVYLDDVAGPTASAQASFSPPTVENPIGSKSVFLTDPAGGYDDFQVNGSRALSYTVPFLCPAEPESYANGPIVTTIDNTASISPTDQSASASVTATCSLPDATPPPEGPTTACVRGQGYWKTHSDYGPATPPDDTWEQVAPSGEDSPFFDSGMSWYEMMWAPPKKGSAYIILAHKYIPAWLNREAGAPINPALEQALLDAETFFAEHTPDEKLDKDARKAAIHLAGLLNNFNDGVVGAPVCGGPTEEDPNEEVEDGEIGALATDGSRVLFGTVLLPLVEN